MRHGTKVMRYLLSGQFHKWGYDLKLKRIKKFFPVASIAIVVSLTSCSRTPAKQGGQAPPAMPVKVETVALQPVPVSDSYVATPASARAAAAGVR